MMKDYFNPKLRKVLRVHGDGQVIVKFEVDDGFDARALKRGEKGREHFR